MIIKKTSAKAGFFVVLIFVIYTSALKYATAAM